MVKAKNIKETVNQIEKCRLFTPKGGRFCEENFLRYLDLCYVNPTCHKLKTIPLS